jgi:hypothetical protein
MYAVIPQSREEKGLMLITLQVLTEVRNAPKTLRKAAPIAISVVTVLYVLANISYVSYRRMLPCLCDIGH